MVLPDKKNFNMKNIKKIFIIILFLFFLTVQNSFNNIFAESEINQDTRGIEIEKSHQSSDVVIEGDYWAFIIGINEYSHLTSDKQLLAARPDAQAIADILQNKYGFAKERIITLFDTQATRSQIIKNFRIFAKTLSNKDNLLIYYAGHGEYDKETQLGGWIPSDAELKDPSTFISNEEVRGYLKAIKARHIYTIADSCFSESLLGGKTRSISQLSNTAIKELYNDKSRLILTSGGLYPVPDKGKGNHSTFAYYLLRILERNENKYLIPQQIIAELQPLVTNESQQTPKCAPITGIGDEGGQFVLVYINKKEQISDDLNKKETEEKLKEEKTRLVDDIKKLKEEALKVEREFKEKLEHELKDKAAKMEEESILKEKEQKRRFEEEQRKIDQQKKELEKNKKNDRKEEPVFIPPTF